MKLICSLFYHRISGRYLANIFFHLTMYGWDSLSSLYTRDIMEIWHIHVSAVLKDYNGTTFIISIEKVGEKRSFHFYWSCVAFAGLLRHKTNDDLAISWCTRKSKSYVEKVLCIFPRTKACYAVRIESVFCCKVRYVIRFWTRTLPTVETVPCNTFRNGYNVQ